METLTTGRRRRRTNGVNGGGAVAESDHRLTADWKVPSTDNTEGISEVLHAMNPEIVVVYPTLMSEED